MHRQVQPVPRQSVPPAPPAYRQTRTVYDIGEANVLLNHGWELLEHVQIERWTRGHHSVSVHYVVGLPHLPVAHAA